MRIPNNVKNEVEQVCYNLGLSSDVKKHVLESLKPSLSRSSSDLDKELFGFLIYTTAVTYDESVSANEIAEELDINVNTIKKQQMNRFA